MDSYYKKLCFTCRICCEEPCLRGMKSYQKGLTILHLDVASASPSPNGKLSSKTESSGDARESGKDTETEREEEDKETLEKTNAKKFGSSYSQLQNVERTATQNYDE